MKTKSSIYAVPLITQKAFISVGVAAYIAQLCIMWPILFNVYQGDWQFSPFMFVVVDTTLLPLILFAIAYFSAPKNTTPLWRVFESTFLAAIGLVIQVITVQALQIIIEATAKIDRGFISGLWYQIIPIVLVLAFYIPGIIRYRRAKTDANKPSRQLRRVFVVLTSGALVLIVGMMLYRIIRQYPYNQNLSSFLLVSVESIFLPILLIGVAYLSSAKKQLQSISIFESLLMAFMGMMLFTVISGIARYVAPYVLQSESGGYWSWALYDLTAVAVTAIIYIIAIANYRRTELNR